MGLEKSVNRPNRILSLFLGASVFLVSIFNLHRLVLKAQKMMFNQDELQHTHIAWNVHQGKKIFIDFYEHHGPLFAWLNSFLFHFGTGPVESVDTLVDLRFAQIGLAALTSLFIALAVANVIKSSYRFLLAGSAGALFLSLGIVQYYIYMPRPDGCVALCLALFLFFRTQEKRFSAGIFLGCALGFHPKFFPINLGVLLAEFLGENKKTKTKQALAVVAGELSVLFLIALILTLQGGLIQGLQFMFVKNLGMVSQRIPLTGGALLKSFWRFDLCLFIAFCCSLIWDLWFWVGSDRKLKSVRLPRLLMALSCLLFLVGPVQSYGLFLVIPFVIFYVVLAMSEIVGAKFHRALMLANVCLILFLTLNASGDYISNEKLNLRKDQENVLAWTLENVDRRLPVFYVWFSKCPAYLFNRDSKREWMRSSNSLDEVRKIMPGTPGWGAQNEIKSNDSRNRLKTERVRYVAIDDELVKFLNPVEEAYLSQYFRKNGCLWIKDRAQ